MLSPFTVSRSFLLIAMAFLCNSARAQLNADFTMNRTGGCSPLTVSFTDLTTGAPAGATYSWDLGNGNSSTLKNPSAVYRDEQSYTVTLKVTSGSQTSTKSKTVTVYKKPVASFTTPAPKICLPASVSFNATATPGDGTLSSFAWDFGDGSVQTSFGSGTSHYYVKPQVATVSLTVTNSYGCFSSITRPDVVEILPSLNPSFTTDRTLLCFVTDSVRFTNTSTGPGPLSYSWEFGDATTSAQTSPAHRFPAKGIYSVRLKLSNPDGCTATSSPTTINVANFNTNFTSSNLCRQVTFNSSSFLTPSSSLWKFGDALSGAGSNTMHTYAAAGSYDVTLINSYSNCKDTVTKTIAVQDLVNYNSTIVAPATICVSGGTNFTSQSSVPPSTTSWNFGNGNVYNNSYTSYYYTYYQPGNYTVTLTNTFGTCTETVTKNITVSPLPELNGFVADFGGVCGAPVIVNFRDTAAGNVTWKWFMDYNSIPFSTSKQAAFNFPTDGTHTITLIVTNAAGCSRQVSKTISVSRPTVNIGFNYSSSPRGFYDCDSLAIRFIANSTSPIQSYDWTLGTLATSTQATPQYTFLTQGVHQIKLSYVTENGCTGTANYQVQVYKKPQAAFNFSIPCGNALSLQFNDASFFSDNWYWNFGNTGTAYYSSPTHSFPDTGRYDVTFVSHIGHCSDTIRKVVYANKLPASVNITTAQNTCGGNRSEVTFNQQTVRASGGTWDFGDGVIIPFDTSVHNLKHTYAATGMYNVKLTTSYDNCTLISTRQVYVLLKQNPVLTGNKSQFCASGNMTATVGNMQTNPYGPSQYNQYSLQKFEYNNGQQFTGSISNYYWNFNAYTTTLQQFSPGNVGLRVITTSYYFNCQDTSNYIPLQIDGPVAGFKVLNNNTCYKSPVRFQDTSYATTSTPITRWYWDFGDGYFQNNTTNAPVSHTYSYPGSYTVRLTITDATGCSTISMVPVSARGPKANFYMSGSSFLPNVPLNTTINFINNTNTSYSGTVNYTWHFGDGGTSSLYSPSHTYPTAGTDTIKLIATDPAINCSDTMKQVITVKNFNTAFSFTTTFIGGNSCPPVQLRINNLSVGYISLVWDFGDGFTSTQPYPSHTYYSPGHYIIRLSTVGYNGLTGNYVDSIDVLSATAVMNSNLLQSCTQQLVQLNAAATGAGSFTWDFGDGIVGTGSAAASHTYAPAGIYRPQLIVSDANGCSHSTQLAQPIVIDSLSVAIKGIPALICDSALINFNPDIYSFSESRLSAPLVYHWDFGTGAAADTSSARTPSFRFSAPGTYTVRLQVRSAYGCMKETSEQVVVRQRARGAIQAAAEVCTLTPVTFTGTATPSDNVQWNWVFSNGQTAAQQAAPAQTYNPGNYTVLMILNRNGCIDTARHALTVHPLPVINATPRTQRICLGQNIALAAGGGAQYAWTPATSLDDPTKATPVAAPKTDTKYIVEVTTANGCKALDSVIILVAQPIDVSMASAAGICLGDKTVITAGGATTYKWIGNTTGLSNTGIADPVAAPTATTTYTVVGYDAYGCFTDTAAIRVDVHALPKVDAGPDAHVVGGVPFQLNATGTPDIVSWNWTPAAQLSCTNCPNPVTTPTKPMTYVVSARTGNDCLAKDTISLHMSCSSAGVHIPDAFTPNGDSRNDLFYVKGTGVNTILSFRIYDRSGALVFERKHFNIDDAAFAWDGKHKGNPMPSATYVYVSEMECITGDVFTVKGTVTLIR